MRFTVDGSQALEDRIAQDLFEIREAVLARVGEGDLSGLILGGGYGRGEGGVFLVDSQERVYNDYDFFVIVPYSSRSRRKALMEALSEVKAAMEPRCGIHVDFSPAMPQVSLATLPYEVMYMELKEGHHVVIGSNDILATMPPTTKAHPPLEECARLFMNRGVGLLLARQKLEMGKPLDLMEHEFVVRNIRKAQLAMGDALLYLKGCYSPSYLERRALFRLLDLEKVPDGEILSSYYEEALEFKFCPNHDGPIGDALQIWYDEVTRFYGRIFLWFEQYRLSDPGLSWESYQRRTRRLTLPGVQESVTNVLRNLHIKTSHYPPVRELFLHPRDRVLAHLPMLLFGNVRDQRLTADVLRLWEYCG